ncbi:MAG: cell division protein FtsQ/DivIB [Oscillospiraceae bacterium]|nr:FtsQ-type POTRA domain-containing protein [Oscillospiraceae bacterium]
MQNVKKVNIENKNNQKRNRRRRKNMFGYYVLVAVLASGIAASLSVTLLFNVHEVEITGLDGASYTEEEIVSSSGISRGDNLVRMNTEEIRTDMLSNLLLIDDVKIKKSFPHKVEMNVVPSVETAYVECSGGYVLISENWRIIGQKEKPENKNLIVVKGFDCVTSEEKTILTSNDHDKGEILKNILDEIKKQNIEKMVSVDISDKYDIELNYDNRITIKIEKPDDVEYKLKYAYKIITDELRENKNGYLIYRNSLGYSYVSEEEYNRINSNTGISLPQDNDESTSPEITDIPVSEETASAPYATTASSVTANKPVPVTAAAQQEGW